MKKRILFIYPEFMMGGSTTSLLNLLNELDYKKYDVDIALRKNRGPLLKYIPKEVKVLKQLDRFSERLFSKIFKVLIFLSSIKFYKFIYYKIIGKNSLANQMSSYFQCLTCRKINDRYDVAISFLEGFSNVYVNSKKVSAAKKISWIHVDYLKAGFNIKYDLNALNISNYIVFVSDACLEQFKMVAPELSPKLKVVKNVVSLKTIKLKEKEFFPIVEKLENDNFKILTVCRLDTYTKGLDRMFSILEKLIIMGQKVQWCIIGGNPDKQFNELYEKFLYKKNIILLGQINNPFPYFKLFDLFVLPSRFEGKPMVVTESMLLNLPVLVTDYASSGEQVTNNYNGIIVGNEENSLFTQINDLINNPSRLNLFKENLLKENNNYTINLKEFDSII